QRGQRSGTVRRARRGRRPGGRRVARGGIILEDRQRGGRRRLKRARCSALTLAEAAARFLGRFSHRARTRAATASRIIFGGRRMFALLLSLHLIVCLCLVAVILVQSGKGGGLAGGAFGGATQTVFGGRGATDFITRATVVLGVLFFCTSLSLALLTTRGTARAKSIVSEAAKHATPGAPTLPGGTLPPGGGVSPQAPAPTAPAAPTPAPAATPASPSKPGGGKH